MRRFLILAAGLVVLAATALTAPAQAMPLSAPAALKDASNSLAMTEQVYCYGGGCGYYRPYYRPYYGYRRYGYGYGYGYRPYGYGYGGYGYGYRPYYRSYYGYGGGCGGCGYGYGYRRSYWAGGYGYYDYAPRPRYYFGPRVYWW